MRFAIILAILAQKINKIIIIFQLNYHYSDTETSAFLCNLAAVNSEKESFCQSMLRSIDNSAKQASL